MADLVASLAPERVEIRGRRLIVLTQDPTAISIQSFIEAGAQTAVVGTNWLHLIGDWHEADWIGVWAAASDRPRGARHT
jgi:hypothetical protein